MIKYPNWFDVSGRSLFEQFLVGYAQQDVNFLQIGAYTGDATEWLMNNVINRSKLSKLTDVDTWAGSDEAIHKTFDWSDVERHYTARFVDDIANGKLRKLKTSSDKFFARNKDGYDFIYIDGDHTALGVLKDGINAYDCLKVGGLLAFDDYLWEPSLPPQSTPKLAVNVIATLFDGRLEVVHSGYQVWFRKIS